MTSPNQPRTRRRWLHFSLRTLLLSIVVCSILLALYVEPVQRQWRAAASVQRLGGRIEFGRGTELGGPKWLRELIKRVAGEEYSQAPLEIYFGPNAFTDNDMKHIARMSSLRRLNLVSTNVSNEGMPHLAELKSLQELLLCRTRICDEGVQHLEGLVNLKELYLNHTDVSVEGVERLKRALPNCAVHY